MNAAALVLAATLAQPGSPAPAACPAELVRIARSKNANVVVYEANRSESGALDADDPVRASWVMLAERGQREGLTFFERLLAYGFDVRSADPDAGYVLRLKAKKDQAIRVVEHQGCPAAMSDIGGRKGILKRIYVQAEDGQLIPPVLYVELFGIDPATGSALYDKIVPDPGQQVASLADIREGRRGGVAGTR
jgi:hypothetical protein